MLEISYALEMYYQVMHIFSRAIAVAAGKALLQECKEILKSNNGKLRLAQVVKTTAGNLNKIGILYVIHACGPRNDSFSKKSGMVHEYLTNTFYNVLKFANDELRVESVSIPAISSGTTAIHLWLLRQE